LLGCGRPLRFQGGAWRRPNNQYDQIARLAATWPVPAFNALAGVKRAAAYTRKVTGVVRKFAGRLSSSCGSWNATKDRQLLVVDVEVDVGC